MAWFLPLLLVGALVGAGVAVAFWDELREWAIETAIPWVERHFGPGAAAVVRFIGVVLDLVATWVRRTLFVRVDPGSPVYRIHEEYVAAEDLPDDVRQMLYRGPVAVQVHGE
ncbi:MAG: hypothetical protein RMK74_16630 [Myxococcales bacterium]|nr:hypothetical protein [Myxococcales bacterium]